MDFDGIARILVALCAAFLLVTLVRALRTGRYGYGSAAVLRASDPGRFRHSIAVGAAFPAAFALSMFDSVLGSAAVQLLLAACAAFYPWRWLRSGEAGWENAMFSRRDEPLEYWLLVAAVAAMILAMTALSVTLALQARA